MLLTPKVIKAIEFAAVVHREQKRKSQDVPYVVHPFGVAMLLAKYGYESDLGDKPKHLEDIIVAGLLHDTIEDTGTTKEQIEKEFGENVAKWVTWETEPDKSLPWAERKRAALDQLRRAPVEAKYIKAADATYNMRDMIEGYKRQGEDFWKNFKSGKENQIARMAALVATLNTTSFDGGWWGLKNELQETFDELAQLF